MSDASILMDLLKIVSEIKKPIQISVGDKDYTLDFQAKKIIKGKATNPELAVGLAEADFIALQTGKLNPMQAFMQGKIKPKGNVGILLKFQPLQPKLEKLREKNSKKSKL